MLVVNLVGGLGNQLFQYAAGRALAVEQGVELKLDISDFVRYPPRQYLLHHFAIEEQLATPDEIGRFDRDPPRWSGAARRLLARLRGRGAGLGRTIFERGFPYQVVRFDPSVDTLLIGYWQSERYFLPIAPRIRREFTLRAAPPEASVPLFEAIDREPAVSLHVRRGDYVSNPAVRAKHGVCGLDYYQAAVARILTVEPSARFYLFSDDLDWVRSSLRIEAPCEYVDLNGPDQPYEDLRLMSRCRHHIIANSSLSWWGAWLDPRPDKVVIAPRQWFAPGSKRDARDIVPGGWIRI